MHPDQNRVDTLFKNLNSIREGAIASLPADDHKIVVDNFNNCYGMAFLALVFMKWIRWEAHNAFQSEEYNTDKFDPFVESLVCETCVPRFVIQLLMITQYIESS